MDIEWPARRQHGFFVLSDVTPHSEAKRRDAYSELRFHEEGDAVDRAAASSALGGKPPDFREVSFFSLRITPAYRYLPVASSDMAGDL